MDEHEYSGEYRFSDYPYANRMYFASRLSKKILRVLIVLLLVLNTAIAVANPCNVVTWVLVAIVPVWLSYPHTILPIRSKRLWTEQKQPNGPVKMVLAGS